MKKIFLALFMIVLSGNYIIVNASDFNEPDSWYGSVFLGAGQMRGFKDYNDILKNADHTLKSQISYFINLSFYKTMSHSILLGGGISGMINSYDAQSGTYSEHNVLGFILFHLDLKIFLDEISSGFFISFSPGIGSIQGTQRKNTAWPNDYEFGTDYGFGFRGGIGYAINMKRFRQCLLLGAEGYYIKGKGTYGIQGSYIGQKEITLALAGAFVYLGYMW